jgi:hypothetical protein
MTGLTWAQTTIRTGHNSNDMERRHVGGYIDNPLILQNYLQLMSPKLSIKVFDPKFFMLQKSHLYDFQGIAQLTEK